MKKIRLTAAQAMVKYLIAQKVRVADGSIQPLFGGVFAIFGHGNVAALGEALNEAKNELPTFRGHNEQSMAHAAIAFAKQKNRRQMMLCTSSIGPGAANMVTSAALAHVNRLPVLFVPGDTFASRVPDPVLQQIEAVYDPNISTNDCFKPVSRFFDRISRPEQLIVSLPAAIRILTDPADCGPATLSFCQDVQAEAFDYPESFFDETIHCLRRQLPAKNELTALLENIKAARRPLIVAGGGVHYSHAVEVLNKFVADTKIPVAETQAGKSAMVWKHPQCVGSIGVTGSVVANKLARESDLIIAIGTRLQDFTTASRTLTGSTPIVHVNVSAFDAHKHGCVSVVGDAKLTLEYLNQELCNYEVSEEWKTLVKEGRIGWNEYYESVTSEKMMERTFSGNPSDAQILGAIKRTGSPSDVVICAAGGLPGELHKLWRCDSTNTYHVEYGYSCMGYEIAAGLGVKLANPEREAIVVVGDGSYLMLNSEIATSVMLGKKIIVVVLDNRGYACINRLQQATGNEPFNNLLKDCLSTNEGAPIIDFSAHAASLGANSEKVESIAELETAMGRARESTKTYVICIDTDPYFTTEGGYWWDVAVPEVSNREQVNQLRLDYEKAKRNQPY
ncbi:3D-(3,5/4)-trihydroxycyclohexane-1,2-dione hydrolase [Alteromonas macleodii]|uniref:3D-(3,5/4)-trihydroxycyclohexane-1,2-dione acylhydrolase (decyclizing) n=1 Tax=Alteromonas macleodii TaxID=28108 RepID=UPI00057DFCEE|nr:3D-(3,5/4)-trihydroxycyclohexane-1,2-dione acylhydrolase (decyclizing) [Alteromonas macleodii]KHT51475.1 3D-(3,5/4)-trihydroxycyclohexane-1,2-dione hydrolase [Alteromonas macleodii]